MPAENRSFVDVVEDVVSNVPDIVSPEVRLARAEITEAKKAATASRVLVAGVVLAFYAVGLLLHASVYTLMRIIPAWAAALVVFGSAAAIAGALILVGREHLKHVHTKPEATIQSVRENVQWLTTPAR